MARIFISYSRVDKSFVEELAAKLRRIYGYDNVWFDEGLHGGDIWWEEILDQIEARDIFLYVLSNESVQSKYCKAEFEEARRLQKQIITVQARDRTKLTEKLGDIHYIDMAHDPNDANAFANLVASINKREHIAKKRKRKPLWEPRTPKPDREDEKSRSDDAPDVETPTLQLPRAELERPAQQPSWWKKPEFLIGAILIPIITAIIGGLIQNPEFFGMSDENATEIVQVPTRTGESDTDTPSPTSISPTATNTEPPAPTPTSTPEPPTATSTPDIREPETVAFEGVNSNAEWENLTDKDGYVREFNGVDMVLVPKGRFEMGSTNSELNQTSELCIEESKSTINCSLSKFEDEKPISLQTLDAPFWIDLTEVSRTQYAECVRAQVCDEIGFSDFSNQMNHPISPVTWYQARVYCEEWRNARLPTELEWEYAARGPDRPVFPWGDDFIDTLANHCDSNCDESTLVQSIHYANVENNDGYAIIAPVGTYPSGRSWVGALDMSGNVWEWTKSLYRKYPYDAEDGREDAIGARTNAQFVLRGGSFNLSSYELRMANRIEANPWDTYHQPGFRCARDYN